MRSLILSQWRDLRIGVTREDLGALTTVRDRSDYTRNANVRTTGWAKKVNRNVLLHQILADFQNSFIVTICRKFAMQQTLNNPYHLKRVGSLQ